MCVSVGHAIRQIYGVTQSTTCHEIVVSLARSLRVIGEFSLLLETSTTRRSLEGKERPLELIERAERGGEQVSQ